MKNNDYYVYALIDPRDNQYFYIGKGRGKRYMAHLKKNPSDSNLIKLTRISEIKKDGHQVIIEILFPNLCEAMAFELEKAIIYKLGRQVLNEGILTNMNPGGNWKINDSVLYPQNYHPDVSLDKLDFVAREKFLSIKTIRNSNYLNTENGKQIIYRYTDYGCLDMIKSLNCFLLPSFTGNNIEILKALNENDLPIYHYSIYSKKFYSKIYISKHIPYTNFDIIDEQFNKDFDSLFEKEKKFHLEFYSNKTLRLKAERKVERKKNIVTLLSYYVSGKTKSFRQSKNNLPFGESRDWYENGNLKFEKTHIKGQKGCCKTYYYENGNKKLEESDFNGKKNYKKWFENGKIKTEFFENIGYVEFNELGLKTKTAFEKNKIINEKNQLCFSFPIELTKEMKGEKRESDLDWQEYENLRRNQS